MRDVIELGELSNDQQRQVRDLAAAATAVDGVEPLGEQVRIGLGRAGHHLVVTADDSDDNSDDPVVGYAQLDPAAPSAELVVHPAHRQRGVGTRLVAAVVARAPGVRIWAHGSLPGAAAIAELLGLRVSRRLLQLELADLTALPEAPLPAGLQLRSFLPGLDEPEWLALNARAFTDLPDQGGWTGSDLADRQAQPWFDPHGFLVAVDDSGVMVGFHWTKIEEQPRDDGGHEHVGEVYVVGVDPSQRGRGLGRALTLAGLHHLRSRGVQRVTLYVDGANTAARALYDSLGFSLLHADTEYAHVVS